MLRQLPNVYIHVGIDLQLLFALFYAIFIFAVCKSCIVRYLKNNNNCPTCKIVIHQSHPLNYISLDRTLQHIVYKVVPGLFKKQRSIEESFHKENNLELPVRVGESKFEYEDLDLDDNESCNNDDCNNHDNKIETDVNTAIPNQGIEMIIYLIVQCSKSLKAGLEFIIFALNDNYI